MKLGTKINVFSIIILTTMALAMVIVGTYVITEIVYSLNKRLMSVEITNLTNKVKQGNRVLSRSGVSKVENYVKRMQQQLVADFKRYSFGKTGNLFVIEKPNKVVFHKDLNAGRSLKLGNLDKMFEKGKGFVEYRYKGRQWFCVFNTFPQWNWLIALSITKEEMFEKRSEYFRTVSVISVVVLFICAMLTRSYMGKLASRVIKTLAIVNKVEHGEMTARIEAVTSKDEIGSLQRGVNSMITSIQERTAELQKINEKLFLEVVQRKRAETNLMQELTKFQALYDLAVAMTGDRTLDENLALVVEKGRELLKADTAYLALVDESERALYVQSSSGIRSEEFKKTIIPMGDGLGGKVAKTGKPHMVEDYFQEVGTSFHDVVRSEGLISGIAVPVQSGQVNLGVLYVFNRIKTTFLESQVDTLSLLANLAAVEITRSRAEAGLRASEERYRTLVENVDLGVTLVDSDHRILMTNAARARMVNKSPNDLIGKKCFTEFKNTDVACEDCPGIDSLITGKPAESETQIEMENGARYYLRIKAFPIIGANGQSTGFIEFVEDVTERKHAEQELARVQGLLMAAIESSPAGILIADAPEVTFRLANSNALGLASDTGRPLSEIPPELHPEKWQTFHPNGLPFEREDLPLSQAILHGTVSQNVEGIIRRPGKEDQWVLANAAPVRDPDGEIVAGIVVFLDITEHKRLEEQLGQAAKMEAIGQLAGGVAHDFNNLLTAMMGYSNMLQQQLPEDSPHQHKITQINRAAERAAALTQQLLAFSRKQVLNIKVLDLNTVISEFEEILRRLIGEHIDLVTVLSSSLARVKADRAQIEQILMNLAINARDVMPNGGTLTMESANTYLDEDYVRLHAEVVPGPYIMITVSDTGPGMDAVTLSRIFDPFFTTKGKGRGTGLGLSTVYGIVKQHQGHITVYSELGHGTVFKVYLPQVEETLDRSIGTLATQIQPGGDETVLLVEDEQIVRDMAREMLETLGYSVLCAEDPEKAIDISRQFEGTIDLLLTDVIMPKMDGKSLFTLLSKQRPEMKVIYASGYTDNTIVHHGVLAPGIHFLHKPFTIEVLAEKVREVIDET